MLDLSARVISRGITWHALCFSSSLSCGGRQADPALSLVNPSSLSPQSVPGHPSCSPHETIPPYLAAGNRERERERPSTRRNHGSHTQTHKSCTSGTGAGAPLQHRTVQQLPRVTWQATSKGIRRRRERFSCVFLLFVGRHQLYFLVLLLCVCVMSVTK